MPETTTTFQDDLEGKIDAAREAGDAEEVNEEVAAEPEADESAEATPEAEEILTHEEEILQHYDDIRVLNAKVEKNLVKWTKAKKKAAAAKSDYDGSVHELTRLIANRPDPQRPMFNKGLQDPEAWRQDTIHKLNLSDGLLEKLEENGIKTTGDLQDFWTEGGRLDLLEGIGEEKSTQVSDVYNDYQIALSQLDNVTEVEPSGDDDPEADPEWEETQAADEVDPVGDFTEEDDLLGDID